MDNNSPHPKYRDRGPRTEDRGPRTRNAGLGTFFRILDGQPGVMPLLARGGLRLLSWLYGAGLEVNLAAYPLGLARVTRLAAEVIGVGNLSMGGTGKTLAVTRLAREYLAAGKRVAILSRGHGRRAKDAIVVVATPEGVQAGVQEGGDEPLLLASSLPGVPVLVGKDRRRTGQYALDAFQADVLLLDDSFQYWRLHKDREIVLIDALQPSTRDHLFPRGLLREPWSHLRRAQEVWVTHAELAPAERVRALAARIVRHAPHAAVRYTEHRPTRLRALDGREEPLAALRGRRVLAVSGLGNPAQFEMMLATLGAEVTPCRFPDHHFYTGADIAAIAALAPADTLVATTAKDAMRLPADLPFTPWVVEVELVEVE